MQMSVIGPDNTVHYRRPEGDPLLDEAKLRPGYRVVPTHKEDEATGKHVPSADEPPRCPVCGYSQQDQDIHFDHHLCSGTIPTK